MIQSVYTLVFTSIFLSLGLISCSPDKGRTIDSFKVPPPKIVRAGENKATSDLKTFDSGENRVFDLRDLIDASTGNPTLVKSRARCRAEKREFEVHRTTRASKFRILQIVPPELFGQDLNKTVFLCNFELTVFNDVGSAHIFNLADVALSDNHGSELQITGYDGRAPADPFLLNADNARDLMVSFPSDQAATGQIMCEDLHYSSTQFQNSWELKDFNERRYQVHKLQSNAPIAEKSPQRCRIVVSVDEMPVATSRFFKIIIPRPPFEIQVREAVSSAVTEHDAKATVPLLLNFGFKNRPLVLVEYTLINREPIPRRIRVPHLPAVVRIHSYFEGSAPRLPYWERTHISPRWLYLIAPTLTPLSQNENSKVFQVPASSSAVLHLVVAPPGPMNCIGSKVGNLAGITLEPTLEQWEINEVGATNESVSSFYLPPPPKPVVALSMHPYFFLNSAHKYKDTAMFSCSWP